MQRVIKFFVPILILYLLVSGINYTISKYVLSYSYDVNVIVSIDNLEPDININDSEGIKIDNVNKETEFVTSNEIINELDLEENSSIQDVY